MTFQLCSTAASCDFMRAGFSQRSSGSSKELSAIDRLLGSLSKNLNACFLLFRFDLLHKFHFECSMEKHCMYHPGCLTKNEHTSMLRVQNTQEFCRASCSMADKGKSAGGWKVGDRHGSTLLRSRSHFLLWLPVFHSLLALMVRGGACLHPAALYKSRRVCLGRSNFILLQPMLHPAQVTQPTLHPDQ